jgi:hypothetical protein
MECAQQATAAHFLVVAVMCKHTGRQPNHHLGCHRMPPRDGRNANTRHRPLSAPLGSLLHILLRYGEGLWLGPDCDGCLNLCLPPSGTPADTVKDASPPPHPPPSTPGSSSSKPLSPGAKDACQLSPGQWPAVAHVPAALPAAAYSLSALLSAGQLEGSYGAAAKPRGVVTTPKHFQLQVGPGTRRLLACVVFLVISRQ